MTANSATELKRRLAVHAINLANYGADLEKSEIIRNGFLAGGDAFQAGLAEEVSNAYREKIDFIKELIVQDSNALAAIEAADNRSGT